jgi:penicillin-binding protein 1A
MPKYIKSSGLYRILFWFIFSIPFILIMLLFIFISSGTFGFMPTFEDLENPKNNISSEVISEDGVVLGTFYYQNRSFVSYNEISPNIINALIATEDIRYYKHSGIDFRGLARVFFKTVVLGNNTGGGSTISQQLAKNLFPRDTTLYESLISRKFSLIVAKLKEWVTAVKLERNYTKEEIIVMYLNTVGFSSQAYGIKMASKSVFNKSPDSLKIEEAAILIGMLKAPSYYSPIRNPENSKRRRNIVLSQMARYGYITERQCDSLCYLPLKTRFSSQDHNEGPATYFREYLRIIMSAQKPDRNRYFAYDDFKKDSLEWYKNPLFGWCNKNKKPDGSSYNLYTDGLKIYTTINSKMQKYAEEALKEQLGKELQPVFFKEKKGMKNAPFASNLEYEQVKELMELSIKRTERYRVLHNAGYTWSEIMRNFRAKIPMTVFSWTGDRDTIMCPYDSIRYYKYYLQAGFMAMDPHTGYVKAYVGGPNFRHFKYDHVTIGKRQSGSTIKPFLYTLAMEEGYSPCYRVPHVPVTFLLGDTTWTPGNAEKSIYEGRMVSLKWGLAHSSDWIAAWLMKQFNPPSVIEIMQKMGFTSYLAPYPSLVLGTSDVTLYEMVGSYATFANKGIFTQPIFVTRIEDKSRNVLGRFVPEKVEAISEQTAYLMLNLLEGVVNNGTGYNIRYKFKIDYPVAGKTGTTQNHSDGWYLGITPDLVAGAWVGAEDRSVHFDEIALGSGSHMALPIWANFMLKVYADKSLKISIGDFKTPPDFNYELKCSDIDDAQLDENDLKLMEGE